MYRGKAHHQLRQGIVRRQRLRPKPTPHLAAIPTPDHALVTVRMVVHQRCQANVAYLFELLVGGIKQAKGLPD